MLVVKHNGVSYRRNERRFSVECWWVQDEAGVYSQLPSNGTAYSAALFEPGVFHTVISEYVKTLLDADKAVPDVVARIIDVEVKEDIFRTAVLTFEVQYQYDLIDSSALFDSSLSAYSIQPKVTKEVVLVDLDGVTSQKEINVYTYSHIFSNWLSFSDAVSSGSATTAALVNDWTDATGLSEGAFSYKNDEIFEKAGDQLIKNKPPELTKMLAWEISYYSNKIDNYMHQVIYYGIDPPGDSTRSNKKYQDALPNIQYIQPNDPATLYLIDQSIDIPATSKMANITNYVINNTLYIAPNFYQVDNAGNSRDLGLKKQSEGNELKFIPGAFNNAQ